MTEKIRLAKNPTVAGILARGTYRFLTGRPLADGELRTDATWTHRGTRALTARRPSKWHYLTKTERVAVRLAGAGGVTATGYGMLTDPAATTEILHVGSVSVGSAAAFGLAYKTTDAVLHLRHWHDWVWPLHVVLKEALGLPEGTRPRHYLTVPRDYNEITGDAIKVELPPARVLDDEVKRRVESALSQKLALQDVSFTWHVTGPDSHVIVKQKPRPPALARASEDYVRDAIASATPDAPVIGISHSAKVVAASLDHDSPHILVVMGTGGGKSELLKSLAAQLMHHGAQIVVLDYKQTSQPWLRRIPGVKYARSIEAIHDALLWVGEEAHRRRTATAEWIDAEMPEGGPNVGPRLVVLFEEANSTIPELKDYWTEIRDKDDPKTSPAIKAYRQALNMGRSERVNLIVVGQDGRFQVIGDRNNFAVIILGKYNRRMWDLLAPGAGTAPKKSRKKGRVQVVMDDTARETQGILWTDQEAIEWAMAGIAGQTATPTPPAAPAAPAASTSSRPPAAPVDGSHDHSHTAHAGVLSGETRGEGHTDEPVTMPEQGPAQGRRYGPFTVISGEGQGGPAPAPTPAADHGQAAADPAENGPELLELLELKHFSSSGHKDGRAILPMSYDALRRAKSKDPEFPPPDGKRGQYDAWREETLTKWFNNRPSAQRRSQ